MSLFWKIFGWFWVSHALVTSATIVYFVQRGPSTTPRSGPTFFPYLDWPPLMIFLSIGAVVSFCLARYLASPTMKLRQATHQLAEGDFAVRVGSRLGRRRDEIADMARDFDVMAERIEIAVEAERRTVEAQQRLLADISHELRSPLARLAYALDLARGSANEETSNYLKRIERESARLNELIGQLLTLARLEAAPAREAELQAATTVDLSNLVAEVCQDADFEARGRAKEVRFEEKAPCVVKGSPHLLRSAIENVVRNAVRHTPAGTAVKVTLCANAQQAIITVRDFGAGAPEELLSELFRPFYRVEQARDRESGGVGLGLSITDRALRFHGGSVTAENVPGGGLLFELRLPLLKSPAPIL